MPKETQLVQMSGYLFLLGVVIAVIAGLVPTALADTATTILLVLGTLIGLLAMGGWSTLTIDEERTFLLATIALIAAGGSGAVFKGIEYGNIGPVVAGIIGYIAILVAPAAVLIALYMVWRVGAGKLRLGR